MRKPSPAMLVSLAAPFVALGGVGLAATGGNFILARRRGPRRQASAPTRRREREERRKTVWLHEGWIGRCSPPRCQSIPESAPSLNASL
jgi:hypothetical protein